MSLAMCLHQITAMAGIPKTATNAIHAVAFLLEELIDTQINVTIKEALDSQITEFSSDMKLLIEDAKEKISDHIKSSTNNTDKISTPSSGPQQQDKTYALILINPPVHANPKLAAKEGIKARQFFIERNKRLKALTSQQPTAQI